MSDHTSNIVSHALRYVEHGFALTPLLPRDKRPYLKEWGKRAFTAELPIRTHWLQHADDNVGIVLGPRSNVVDIEYDTPAAGELLDNLLSDDDKQTPSYASRKSVHRLYRLPDPQSELYTAITGVCGPSPNVVACEGIEIRMGLDGQAQSVAPPSVTWHADSQTLTTYAWLEGLTPWNVEPKPLPVDVVERVLERICIRDEGRPTPQERPRSSVVRLPDGDRPGDIYNAKATWHDVLDPAGWTVCGTKGDLTLWVHPGSQSGSHSGATGWVSQAGNELLQVYSSNTPFKIGMGAGAATYTKFEAYAVLYHNSDRTAAARDLANKGYKPDDENHNDGSIWRVDLSSILEGTTSCK